MRVESERMRRLLEFRWPKNRELRVYDVKLLMWTSKAAGIPTGFGGAEDHVSRSLVGLTSYCLGLPK